MNKNTKILFGTEAREKILKGVKTGYDAVRLTMGPEGKNALFYGTFGRKSRITNDGYTVLESIELKDEFESLALSELKNAAKKTNSLVGDGTSATTVIAGKLLIDVFSKLSEEQSAIGNSQKKEGVMTIRKNLLNTAKQVEEDITKTAKKVATLEELKRIATISVEDEKIGDIIATMSWKVGENGFIDIIEGFKGEVETEIIEGARFPAKIAAKGFVNNASQKTMEAKDVAVLLTNFNLDNVNQVAQFLNPLLKTNAKIAIFAPEFSQDVLSDFWKASYSIAPGGVLQKKTLEIYPIKAPSLRSEQWEDLEVYFGARFINKERGMKLADIREVDLGFANKIVVKDTDARDDAIALGGKGASNENVKINELEMLGESPVKTRIAVLLDQVKETKDDGQKNLLKRRIASLGSAIGVIRVGSPSDSETYYLKKKIEDAVYACKAAMEEGYVKGGGVCLKEIAEALPEDNLLRNALLQPYNQIQENADGFLEIREDVIDPAKAIRLAVRHAVSVVATLITVGVVIAEEREISEGEGNLNIAIALNDLKKKWAQWKGIWELNTEEAKRDELAAHDAIIRNHLE